MIEFHISLNPTSFDNKHLFLEDDNKHLITQTKQNKTKEWPKNSRMKFQTYSWTERG